MSFQFSEFSFKKLYALVKIVINDGIVIRVKIATAKNEDEEDVLFQDPHELRKSLLVEMVSLILV